MQMGFHYYATYCAAYLSGYSHEECLKIAYSAALVDFCTEDVLAGLSAPIRAATTQFQLEMADMKTDKKGSAKITEIWSSFHFLPGDLYAEAPRGGKKYQDKYRLICNTNSDLLVKTVELARGKGLEAVGIAMHILADTWAHRYFAGTPSLVINNINYNFYERIPEGEGYTERRVSFRHIPSGKDDLEKSVYINTLFYAVENSIMNLGHGRAGHLPDYGFAVYRYLPAWGDYEEILKNNPEDFYHAFCQMVYALKCLKTPDQTFEKNVYDTESVGAYEERIKGIISTRSLTAEEGWKVLGEELSGEKIPDFSARAWSDKYVMTGEKENTEFARFMLAAIRQKDMVSEEIIKSGNRILKKSKWGRKYEY